MKRSLGVVLLRGLWGLAYAAALVALMSALGLALKAPTVRVNQYLYTLVFLIIKFGLARLILSPLHPVPAIFGAFCYARSRSNLDREFAEKTSKKHTHFAQTAKKRGEPSKNGSFRPGGAGAITAATIIDAAGSAAFAAIALICANAAGMAAPSYVIGLAAVGVFAVYYAACLPTLKTTLGRVVMRVKVVWKGGKRLVIIMTKPSSQSR